MVSSQARKDELEEQRLRKSLNKLSNHCRVNQLSTEFISSESGADTDGYDIIDMDSEGFPRASSSPLQQRAGLEENEYDIISSENDDDDDDVISVKGVKKKGVNNAENVQKARDRLKIKDGEDGDVSNALAFFGKSDSSDTLINDSDSDSDLDELVRRNTFGKSDSQNNKLNKKNKNASSEIISRTSAGKELAHAQRMSSDTSADRTLVGSEEDITITITSPDNVTEEVFSDELQNAPRDENKNVIQSLNLNAVDSSDGVVVTNGNVGEVDDTSAINDELVELKKKMESPRQKAVVRVTEDSGSDGEVREEMIERSEVCEGCAV